MNTIRFDSSLTSFKLVRKGEDMFWILQAKIVEDTSIRTFPKQFHGDVDFNGAFDQSAAQDAWEKLIIPLGEYSLEYKMTFSDLVFDVKLNNLTAVRKELKEGYPFAYVWNRDDEFGEFGSVGIKMEQGGLVRTA